MSQLQRLLQVGRGLAIAGSQSSQALRRPLQEAVEVDIEMLGVQGHDVSVRPEEVIGPATPIGVERRAHHREDHGQTAPAASQIDARPQQLDQRLARHRRSPPRDQELQRVASFLR